MYMTYNDWANVCLILAVVCIAYMLWETWDA